MTPRIEEVPQKTSLSPEGRLRLERNRRLREQVAEKFPSGPVVDGFSAGEVFATTLGWQCASDPNYLALSGGLHLADLAESCKEYPLTQVESEAIFGSLMVEDHIPGYADSYVQLFPVQGESDLSRVRFNRRMRSMVGKWVEEESSHADGILVIMLLSNAADVTPYAEPEAMLNRLDAEGAKPYVPPYLVAGPLFTYAAAQERATELYYGALIESVENPIVRAAFDRFRQQEARHCSLFCQWVCQALDRGERHTIEAIQELLADGNFEMPLARMIDGYMQWAVRMRRAARGYKAQEGLEVLRTQVRKVAKAKTGLRDHPVHDLVRMLSPKP